MPGYNIAQAYGDTVVAILLVQRGTLRLVSCTVGSIPVAVGIVLFLNSNGTCANLAHLTSKDLSPVDHESCSTWRSQIKLESHNSAAKQEQGLLDVLDAKQMMILVT